MVTVETLILENAEILTNIFSGSFSRHCDAIKTANKFIEMVMSLSKHGSVNELKRLISHDNWLVAKASQRVLAYFSEVEFFELLLTEAMRCPKFVLMLGQFRFCEELSNHIIKVFEERQFDMPIKAQLVTQILSQESALGAKFCHRVLRGNYDKWLKKIVIWSVGSWKNYSNSLLEEALVDERDFELKAELLKMLIINGKKSYLMSFLELFEISQSRRLVKLVQLFGHVGLKETVPYIKRLARLESFSLRMNLLLAIPMNGDPACIDLFKQLLTSKRRDVYNQALSVFELTTGRPFSGSVTKNEEMVDELLGTIDKNKRYFSGEFWNISNLFRKATYNFQFLPFINSQVICATGKNCGINHLRDAVNNLTALEQWENWLSQNASAYLDGDWYYQGNKVA